MEEEPEEEPEDTSEDADHPSKEVKALLTSIFYWHQRGNRTTLNNLILSTNYAEESSWKHSSLKLK